MRRILREMILTALVVGTVVGGVAWRRRTAARPEARWAAAMARLRTARGAARVDAARRLVNVDKKDFVPRFGRVDPSRIPRADIAMLATLVGSRAEDPETRRVLASTIARHTHHASDPADLAPLLGVVRDESEDINIRMSALSAVTPLAAHPAVLPALCDAARGRNLAIRVAAMEAMSAKGVEPGTVLPILEGAIADPDQDVKITASNALGNLALRDVPGALGILIRAFRRGNPEAKRSILIYMEYLGPRSKEAEAALLEALPGADADLRPRLSWALAPCVADPDRYLPDIVAGLRSGAHTAWEPMALHLILDPPGRFRRDAVIAALTSLLDDPDQRARERAAVILARLTRKPEVYARLLEQARRSPDLGTCFFANTYAPLIRPAPGRPNRASQPAESSGRTGLLAGIAALVLSVVGLAIYIRVDSRRFLSAIRAQSEQEREPTPVSSTVRNLRILRRPRRVHLRRSDDLPWADPVGIAERVEALKTLGFQEVGAFMAEELPSSRFWGLVKPDEAVAAMVGEGEHFGQGPFISLYSRHRDGGGFTLSNATHLPSHELPPGRELVRLDIPDAAELFARFLALRPDCPRRPIEAGDFAADYERFSADLADWINSRGGMTEEELRTLNRSHGIEPTDQEIASLRRRLEVQALRELDVSLRERILDPSGLPDEARARLLPRLAVVHERLPTHMLVQWFPSVLSKEARHAREAEVSTLYDDWVDAEPRRKAASWREQPARVAFVALNKRLPESARFRKLGEIDRPLVTDIYSPPVEEVLVIDDGSEGP